MIRVLIADDHTMFRMGLREVLESDAGISVVGEAEDGAQTLERLRECEVDVVLLDIQMPGRSGIEVLSEIRRLHPSVGVLILSMHPVEQYAIRALKAGALGYLTKERTPYELIGAIRFVRFNARRRRQRVQQLVLLLLGELSSLLLVLLLVLLHRLGDANLGPCWPQFA